MDVADRIVVLAGGRVEQAGAPHEIYDHPASAFVMGFLGPVTRVGGRLVRPHDIELGPASAPDGQHATVTRVVRLGFEVRVEMSAGDHEVWAQVTRAESDALGLAVGETVTIRPRPDARTLAA